MMHMNIISFIHSLKNVSLKQEAVVVYNLTSKYEPESVEFC